MFKGKMWLIVMGIVVVGTFMGWGPSKRALKVAKEGIQSTISDCTPTKLDVIKIETLLQEEAEKIYKFEEEVNSLENKIVGEQQKIEKIEAELHEQKSNLIMAKNLLQQNKNIYFVDGRNRSIHEIESDVQARIKYVENLETQKQFSLTLVNTLSKTMGRCQQSLLSAKQGILAKKLQIEELKAREINAEIEARAASLSKSLMSMSDSILNHSDLQQAMQTYEQKIVRKEKQANSVIPTDAPWINYAQENKTEKEPDLLTQIDQVVIASEK